MAKTQTSALALVLLLATAPLMAQTTETPVEVPVVAADAVTDDGLSMGVEVGGAQPGAPYFVANFEAWEQRCVKSESGIETCQLYMLLKDGEGAATAEFALFSLPAGSEGPAVAGATFIAPLEVLLTTGMSLQIDGAEAKAYPFSVCTQIGCIARLGFTAEEVQALKDGAAATITLVPYVAPDQRVELKLSLAGITAGLAAVDAANLLADEANKAAKAAADQ
jgi:invasion protein IalB